MKSSTLPVIALGLALTAHAQFPDLTPPTPLFAAVLTNDTPAAERLLRNGANPNEPRFLGLTPLHFAISNGNLPLVRALLGAAADPTVLDPQGNTTVHFAAAAENGDPALVQELLKRGISPHLKNKRGETALTVALRRGRTPIVQTLEQSGASSAAATRQAVETALALLQKTGDAFLKVSGGCTSCHSQNLPAMALALARKRGWTVNEELARRQSEAVAATFQPFVAAMKQGPTGIPDPPITMGYALLGLHADRRPVDDLTSTMAASIRALQLPDGHFPGMTFRAPMEASLFTATTLALRSMQLYGGPDSAPHIEKAKQWLRSAQPETTEDRVFQLLGLTWSKAPASEIAAAARALLAQQRPEGGWAQLPDLESDAYATGQTLYALALSGQLNTAAEPYRRGAAYLLRTQFPDGSWLVRSRSYPIQVAREIGFPHGKHQWISAAGTAWAAMALTLTEPAVKTIESGN